MNIFIDEIQKGKISTTEELKKTFWILAKKIHPDIHKVDNSSQLFIKLKENYDEASELLPKIEKDIKHRQYSKQDLRKIFEELVASGFPVEKSIRDKSKLYIDRIKECSLIINRIGMSGVNNFFDVEKDLYYIRGDSIVQNQLFGIIRMMFYNFVTYYYEPKKFTKSALNKWFLEIEHELVERKCNNLYWFLKWQIDNLD
jgi:curved DNA-binding protein CbpA